MPNPEIPSPEIALRAQERKKTFLSYMAVAGVVAAVAVPWPKSRKPEEPVAQRVAEYAKQLKPQTRSNYNWLAGLKPAPALELLIEEKSKPHGDRNFGRTLQDTLYAVSEGLLPLTGGSGATTNEWDLAHTVIPKRTRTALYRAGVRFEPVEPVAFWGGPYDPYCDANDYSDHPPGTFDVTVKPRDNRPDIINIPLGTEQKAYSDNDDPYARESYFLRPEDALEDMLNVTYPTPKLSTACTFDHPNVSDTILLY